MIILTGGAGFIGSCILRRLNEEGREDIIIIDHRADDPLKQKNLQGKIYQRYYDKDDFLKTFILSGKELPPVECVIHMGACSSTTWPDPDYYRTNNLEYSQHLARWSLQHQCKFIYASSAATYGDGSRGYSDQHQTLNTLQPLNPYGQSKHAFDLWNLGKGYLQHFIGLKFFNVYGPNEYHKAGMRSVILKAYPRVIREGVIALFKSYRQDYADGEQQRDFIYVKDAVDIVMYCWSKPGINGIFNVGTGAAHSWNEVAAALFKAAGKKLRIEYIDMPPDLRNQYQYFTQADVSKLRASGYDRPFTPLDEAVADYVSYLEEGRHY